MHYGQNDRYNDRLQLATPENVTPVIKHKKPLLAKKALISIRISVLLLTIILSMIPCNSVLSDDTQNVLVSFNPDGTHIKDHLLKIGFDIYFGEGTKSYDSQRLYVPIEPYQRSETEITTGYIDGSRYNDWWDQVEKEPRINPALHVFITVDPDITIEEITGIINRYYSYDDMAILDDVINKGQSSIHYVSSFMKARRNFATFLIPEKADEKWIIESVNARLSGLYFNFGIGTIQPVSHDSIDIGEPAIDRSGALSMDNYLLINTHNASTENGTVDTVEIYLPVADDDAYELSVGIAYNVGGADFTSRDHEYVGYVARGSKQTITGLDLDCVVGDFIAAHHTDYGSVYIERDNSGDSIYRLSTTFPFTGETFTEVTTETISLRGTGNQYPPDPPATFTLIQNGVDSASCNWSAATGATSYQIWSSYSSTSLADDGFLEWSGSELSANITGLDLNSTKYYIGVRAVNAAGNSVFNQDEIGGESMEITLPTGFYVLIAAISLVFISFFLKSPLIYLAIIPCMIGVLMEPAFKDLWFQSGCVLVMIWAALAFFNKITGRSEKG